jgi:hypothetical protein
VTRDDLGIRVHVELPEGIHRVSLYFFPYRGHSHALSREYRDLPLSVAIEPEAGELKPLLRTRVENFNGGVYKQFLMKGPARYAFDIQRNYGYNTLVNGIFVDKLQGPHTYRDDMHRAMMGNLDYEVPQLPSLAGAPAPLVLASEAWRELESESAGVGAGVMGPRGPGVLTFRMAAANASPAQLLDRWRWVLPVWSPADREQWNKMMALANQANIQINRPTVNREGGQSLTP